MKDEGKKVITPVGEVSFENGIGIVRYFPKNTTIEDTQEHMQLVLENFGDHRPFLVLADIRNKKKSAKDVRSYLLSPEISKTMKAGALLTNSGLSKIVGNLFIKFGKPPYPTKVFTNEQKAIAWLQTFNNN